MKKTVVTSSLLLVLVVGCSEQEKLNDMHDSTVNMEKTTRDMSANTVKMKDQTESLEKLTRNVKVITDELYDALRQGNSLQLRREAYESLLKAPTFFKKLSEAAKYFMSFELQLWNELGQDATPEKREILKQQAAQEFFLEVEELALRDGSVNPTHTADPGNIDSEKNRSAAFNALAVTMHQINRKQLRTLKALPVEKTVSMYSIMEGALLLPKDQAQTSGAAREVLVHEARAIQLLQARYNVFQMIFVEAVGDLSSKNFLQQMKMALDGWEFDGAKLSPTAAEYLISDVLNHALSAKNLLVKLGHKPVLDSTLAKLLNGMKIKSTIDTKNTAAVARQEKIQNLLQQLKAE